MQQGLHSVRFIRALSISMKPHFDGSEGMNYRKMLFRLMPTVLFLDTLLSACHPGMFYDIFNPRPKGPFEDDCSPRPDDPEGYLVKVRKYLNENQIWGGKFHTFEIEQVAATEEDGRKILTNLFSCCGTGDHAGIDMETGEVLYYSVGAW
jgi:hypothetical protein